MHTKNIFYNYTHTYTSNINVQLKKKNNSKSRALPSILELAARRCGLDVICRTLRERKSRLTPRRVTILPLLFLPSTCLYPPGIARQIKHHLLSERPSTPTPRRPSQGGAPKALARMKRVHRACVNILARLLPPDEDDQRARFDGGRGKEKGQNLPREDSICRTHPRVTVCARRILHTIAGIDSVTDLRSFNDILFR